MASVIRVRSREAVSSTSNQFLSDFIHILHENQPLWNTKHPDYSKRCVREICYDELVEKMQEVQPDATREDVAKKINNLRCSFRKEFRKVQRSMETDKLYTPRLWYYNRLLFLIGQDIPALDSDPDNTRSEEPSEDSKCDADPLEVASQGLEEQHSDEDDPFSRGARRPHPYKRRRPKVTTTRMLPVEREEHPSIFGRHVAAKLASVGDEQRVYLEKIINDAIFEAELGNLSRESMIALK